jgi:SAM-dependent methyltransferase
MEAVRRILPPPARRPLRALIDRTRWLWLKYDRHAQRQARLAWERSHPDMSLTWGDRVDGNAFIAKAIEHGVAGRILEVGPGYGRLADSALKLGMPFDLWLGVDLSAETVEHLRGHFPDSRFRFERGDAASFDVGGQVDAVLSSLTWKHAFPTFGPLLAGVGRWLAADGVIVVDLIEGPELRHFDKWGNFIRSYTRREVRQLFGRQGFAVEFDEVVHAPGRRRLLVVARRA